ncbi:MULTISPECIES: PhnA domain-containing protein [unclassified Clostridium]
MESLNLIINRICHNIDCKIDGFGSMCLKSEFVKKI